MFIATLFSIAKTGSNILSIERGVDKDVVHIYDGVLLSYKGNKIMPFAAAWRDLETVILSKVSYTEKDTYAIWNLKKKMIQMNLFEKQKQTQEISKINFSLPKGKC